MPKTYQQGDEISSAITEGHSTETPEERQIPTKRSMIWVAIVVGLLLGTVLFFGMIFFLSFEPLSDVVTTRARSRTTTPTRHPSDTPTELPKTHTPSATAQSSRTMQPSESLMLSRTPRRYPSSTSTELLKAHTPSASAQPSWTPQPSQTRLPSLTPSPKPTQTLPPPTATLIRPTATPQSPTAIPVTVLKSTEVDNGQWGQAPIWVEFKNGIVVNGYDGHRYEAGLGFLSSDESLRAIRECWHRAGRGGANWRMKVVVRKQVAWVSCPSSFSVCYESEISPSQAMLTDQVRYSGEVWEDLLDKYLQYGDLGPCRSSYYWQIQSSIFTPICGQVPSVSCIGFTFAQID